MIIFLYGPDTYRSRQKLNGIIERYKNIHKSGLNLKYYDFETENFQDFQDNFQQTSMFKEKKLMVLENSFSNPDFKEKFLENSERFLSSGNIILFYEQGKINQVMEKDPLFKFLKNKAQSQEFKLLGGQQLKNWAKKEFANYKCKIGEKPLENLIEFIGNDLWRFSNEISKLASFKSEIPTSSRLSRDKIDIKEEDVKLLVKPKIETDIFETIDFLGLKDKKRALELIKKHLEKGDHPLYLLSMINYQFRNLLMIRAQPEEDIQMLRINDLSRKTGIHPYVVRKTIQQAKKFTFEELKKIYQKIFQADLDIKTGKIDPETAIDLLIAEI